MREINISGKTFRVRATPLALLFYKQEFKTDLLGDFFKMKDVADDPSKIDIVFMLQLIWAMAKAEAYGKPEQLPSFFEWVNGLENIDLSDMSFLPAALEEAANGFLSGANKGGTGQPGTGTD